MVVSADVYSRIQSAIDRFKTRMLESNRRYLDDIASYVEANIAGPKRMRAMALSLSRYYHWGGNHKSKTPMEFLHNIPDDVIDGVSMYKPVSAEKREEFVTRLTAKVNEYIIENTEAESEEPVDMVTLPDDYLAMITICNGAVDPTVRFTPILGPGTTQICEVGGVYGSECIDAIHECLLNYNTIDEIESCEFVCDTVGEQWECRTGWMVYKSVDTAVFYGYCRLPEGESKEMVNLGKAHEWKWRIFYDCYWKRVHIFEDIERFLDWLGGWYEREIGADPSIIAEQINDPPFLEGVTPSHLYEEFEDDVGDDAGAAGTSENE